MKFLKGYDNVTIFLTYGLLAFGILVIYSGAVNLAVGQLIFAIIGSLIFLLTVQTDFRFFYKANFLMYVFVILLLILTIFVGTPIRGAVRWIDLGIFALQPSELAKPFVILTLASFFSTFQINNLKNILLSLAIVIVPVLFIFQQPDLGNSLVLLAIWASMFFASGVRLSYLAGMGALAIGTMPVIYSLLEDYQKQRLLTFLSVNDPLGAGYNVLQSTIAVGSGQLFGRGLGLGTQSHLLFLPEFSTDFIFASLAEELGFVGALILICLFLIFIWRGFSLAGEVSDQFGALVIVGVFAFILFQFVINIGMNIGIIPVTGITLPLISYGGSSLISTLFSLGLVVSITKHRKN
ncbi:MAG TPA: rod shape-determining protein RodA [Patescibacteria group bacterium]